MNSRSHTAFMVFVLCHLWASSAAAQSPPEYEPTRWERPPDSDLASFLMPGFANLIGVDGSAKVRCRTLEDGNPVNCGVVWETPAGLGFGSAARAVVASGEVRIHRIAGVPSPAYVASTVNFISAPFDQPQDRWAGEKPSEAALVLSRELVDLFGDDLPGIDLMDGLDYDRRVVVEPWIDELFPTSAEQKREMAILQVARAFGEDRLRRLKAGLDVTWPTLDEIEAACPDFTPEEQTAVLELRRRYCERYECEA